MGYERLEEIENPELAQSRMRALYKAKGYSDEWIEKRVRGIAVRDELTGEWKKRGVKEGKEYSILTAEISKATFGVVPSDYKKLKGLTKPQENLRDHMTDLELIFIMLGEASTTEIAKNKNVQGFIDNRKAGIRMHRDFHRMRKRHSKEGRSQAMRGRRLRRSRAGKSSPAKISRR